MFKSTGTVSHYLRNTDSVTDFTRVNIGVSYPSPFTIGATTSTLTRMPVFPNTVKEQRVAN